MSMSGSRLGAAMYAAAKAVGGGDTAAAAEQRMIAIANAIVSEISTYASIATQNTTSTPADGVGHIHSPTVTATTGKLS